MSKDENVKALLKQYPSPKSNAEFKRMWELFLPEVTRRDNFKSGHLKQLEILCDLYVEYHKLNDAIDMYGSSTYESIGRNGLQRKVYPEVNLIRAARTDIKSYSKHLGLLLVRDHDEVSEASSKEEEEFK